MIARLTIENYALIRHIELDLHPGFNVITGETGAGKSVMLGALGLLGGGRLPSRSVLHPSLTAVVEARFELSGAEIPVIDSILAEAGLPSAGTSLVLRREITPSARSRAIVNGAPTGLAVLHDLSAHLVDIHSQRANQLLSDPTFQLDTLDTVAADSRLLDEYTAIYDKYREALHKYSSTRDEIERTRDDADYLRFQYEKIMAVNPQPGETGRLEAERDRLAAAAASAENFRNAADALSWDDVSALSAVDSAIDAIAAMPDTESLRAELLPRLESLRIELADIAETVGDRASETRDDPADLESVDDRLSAIYSLLSRFGAPDDTALAAVADDMRRRLDALDDAPALLRELKAGAVELKRLALEAADRLTAARTEAAGTLADEIVALASPLAMPNLACRIQVEPGKLNPSGRDTVEWLFAFNKKQPLMPVGATASGGEVSRIMLVLKCVLAGRMGLSTIIFDEVDTGVSGDVAARMGALMARAAAGMQIITITHLPQVAAAGQTHFRVRKHDDESGTVTTISPLTPQQRRAEIAAMLSGRPDDPAALAAADSLLNR